MYTRLKKKISDESRHHLSVNEILSQKEETLMEHMAALRTQNLVRLELPLASTPCPLLNLTHNIPLLDGVK
jgi:hypothetical protein